MSETSIVRVLCSKFVTSRTDEQGLLWLIGSPFFPAFTVVSTFRCIHFLPSDPFSPDFSKESDDIRMLLPRGFNVIGALVVGKDGVLEQIAAEAVDAARELGKFLGRSSEGEGSLNLGLLGAVLDTNGCDVRCFVCKSKNSKNVECVSSVLYEDQPDKYIWERGCMVRCELPIRLPVYYPVNSPKGVDNSYMQSIEAITAKFKDPQVTYIAETLNDSSIEAPRPVIIRGTDLLFDRDVSSAKPSNQFAKESDTKYLTCSYFCNQSKDTSSLPSVQEIADKFQISLLFNRSATSLKAITPTVKYFPAPEQVKLLIVDHKLEVLCYAAKNLSLPCVITNLVIPGLVDQMDTIRRMILPNILMQHPKLLAYHFSPPGFLHPMTVIYELSYGETEMKQVEIRKSLHLRLGLPFDRPLLRIANALKFSMNKDNAGVSSTRRGSTLLKDVHLGIPSSGISSGVNSLVQGSYEYHHYLQDGFDDSGWGCAYRSLQTLISWFRLQHYSSVDVPSHREIQESLVEIGDKDPSFVGSREWIGAIELSFVLDKLLGRRGLTTSYVDQVSCKVINVRSGAELPEKCRELAMHFQTQGTPVMIGGGVLAYTLLGVDYDEVSGDCAFLILDPHYTGNDDLKKVVNGGWCGWKRAVDSKGKHFFLHNKFYNLLLPQRPNMV